MVITISCHMLSLSVNAEIGLGYKQKNVRAIRTSLRYVASNNYDSSCTAFSDGTQHRSFGWHDGPLLSGVVQPGDGQIFRGGWLISVTVENAWRGEILAYYICSCRFGRRRCGGFGAMKRLGRKLIRKISGRCVGIIDVEWLRRILTWNEPLNSALRSLRMLCIRANWNQRQRVKMLQLKQLFVDWFQIFLCIDIC
jgi:hypothetical protein